MRAVLLDGRGDPSVLRVGDVPDPPEPSGSQVLVRVAASSVNGTDLLLRRGQNRLVTLRRSRFVLGFDLAGEVVRCGPSVTAFAPGDRVMALVGHGGGAQAEHVLVPQARAALAPRSVPAEQAAALPLAGLTALQALHAAAGVHARRSPRVLVNGAAGGIGSYAVQLAKLAGASVTAVASRSRAEYLRGLGADEVVDRHERDVTAGDERWDVFLDAPGMLALRTVRRALTPDGVLVSTRPVSADAVRMLAAAPLRRRARFRFVATRASSQDLARLAALVDAGRLRVPLDRAYPLADVAEAHRHAESGTVQGKVVVTL